MTQEPEEPKKMRSREAGRPAKTSQEVDFTVTLREVTGQSTRQGNKTINPAFAGTLRAPPTLCGF